MKDKINTEGKSKEKLNDAIAMIEKIYGKGILIKYGENQNMFSGGAISTGSLSIDEATGIGGVPRGRIVEIYGPESSGKTTLCLHIIAEAQKENLSVAFIDAEHALDPKYAKKIGVNMNKILLSQPDHGEQALDIVYKLTQSGEMDVIVVDSVAALVPKSEIEGEIGDAHMALQARMMSQSLRMITGTAQKTNTCIIFINQLRQKIGVMFGSPETTTGGNALKFYASMRIDIRRIGSIKEGNEVVANETRVKIVKSKVSSPFKEAVFQIRFGMGIDIYSEMIDYAIKYDIIKKGGAWFTFGQDRFQGKEQLRNALIKKDSGLFKILNKQLRGIEL